MSLAYTARHLTSAMKRIFEQTHTSPPSTHTHIQSPSEKYKLSQFSLVTTSPETAKRDQGPREWTGAAIRASWITLVSSQSASSKKVEAFENRHPKQWWELRWLRDSEEHRKRNGGTTGGGTGSRQGGLSRMETSRSKTIGNHPGTTCANYFTKQSLSR